MLEKAVFIIIIGEMEIIISKKSAAYSKLSNGAIIFTVFSPAEPLTMTYKWVHSFGKPFPSQAGPPPAKMTKSRVKKK